MAKRGGFPGGMPGNMNNLMKQAQKMQRQMEEAQQQLEEQEVTATAGGGAVEVTVSGKREITKVKLSEVTCDDAVGTPVTVDLAGETFTTWRAFVIGAIEDLCPLDIVESAKW